MAKAGYDWPLPVIPIDDAADARFADYFNIPDPELLTRRGLFVAEGRLVVERLLESPVFATRSVLVTGAALTALSPLIDGRPDLPVYLVPQAVMDQVTGFHIHRGCLAIGVRPAPASWDRVARGATRLVALERVGNADNVGAVFRCAAAFDARVLLGPACTDPLYRKAIRTSMGAALAVPFAAAEPWPDALSALRERGWHVIGLTPSPAAPLLAQVAASARDSKTALVLGHEGEGLTDEAQRACTQLARIPTSRHVDSLNVAMAAGIALYELTRDAYTPAP